jgi:ABC-2 type transport system permease protein
VAAHVLRLRLALLAAALRGSPSRVAVRVLALAALAAVVVAVCAGTLTLVDASAPVAYAVLVLAGSAIALSFAVGPVVAGAADPLDPRRFAVLGMQPRPLAWMLAGASFVSVPVAAVLAFDVCAAVVWSAHGVPWPVSALTAILHVATCVAFARLSMAFGAAVLRTRRTRELTGLFVLGIVVVLVPVAVFLSSLEWGGRVPSALGAAAEVLGRTPIGAAAALPGALALDDGGAAWLSAIVALATLALAGAAWGFVVERALTTVENPAAANGRGGLGWFAMVPGTPVGVIAARGLVYWLRDSRYIVNVVVIPVAGLLPTVPLLVAGVPGPIVALVPVPIIALFFGWLPHNDVAYDSSAVWIHIASGVRGLADRIGRLVPVLFIALPVLAIAIPVATALYGRWAVLPAIAGVAASLFLTGLGLSSVASVAAPYAVSRPGDSPFQQPQRADSTGVAAQAVVMLGTIVLSAPALWLGWLSLADVSHAVPALWTGLGIGVAVLVAGVALGSWIFERRGERIMAFAGTT